MPIKTFLIAFICALINGATYGEILLPITNDDFSPNGNFVEKKLAHRLSQAMKEKDKAFGHESCLRVRNLDKGGGYNTLQLFLVSSTCLGKEQNYIVKEPGGGISEINKLNAVSASPPLKNLALPNFVAGLPALALPIAHAKYTKDGEVHYLIIMPQAPGDSLASLITKYRENPSESTKAILSKAFMTLGEEVSNFYKSNAVQEPGKLLGKTIIHGDFHPFNIFYDAQKNHFTFIDNETLANSLERPSGIITDMTKLFFMPFSINIDYKQFWDLIEGINLKTWFDISLKNFLIGYLKTYPEIERQKVLQKLRTMFLTSFPTIKWVDFNEDELSTMRQKYFMPIFDELKTLSSTLKPLGKSGELVFDLSSGQA